VVHIACGYLVNMLQWAKNLFHRKFSLLGQLPKFE